MTNQSVSRNENKPKPSLATTQPVTYTQTTTEKTSSKPLTTTQPDTAQKTTSQSVSRNETKPKPSLATTQPVTCTQTATEKTSSKPLATTQPVTTNTTINQTVSGNENNTAAEDEKKDKKPERASPSVGAATEKDLAPYVNDGNQLSHHAGNFPVTFMLTLAVVVAGYFAYHNRTKIHRFIKEGFGRAKQTGSAYVKVKLEDDIELPREANRQYVY